MDEQRPYPVALRAVLNAVEEQAARWQECEAGLGTRDLHPADKSAHERFLTGRASEVLLLKDMVVADWQRGALSCEESVRQIEAFLEELDIRSLMALLVAPRHPPSSQANALRTFQPSEATHLVEPNAAISEVRVVERRP